MNSLARALLRHEWPRFLSAILAVSFASLLILLQIGSLLGTLSTLTLYLDRSSADLWAGAPDTPSIMNVRPIPSKVENRLIMHPAVERVEPLIWSFPFWKRPLGGELGVFLIGLDLNPNALTFTRLLTPQLKQLLQIPGNVIVDKGDLNKLGVKVGDTAELNGKQIKVVATIEGMQTVAAGANVISSLYTARNIDKDNLSDDVKYFLIKLRAGFQAEQVRDQLQPQGSYRPYEVWTTKQFSIKSRDYWIFESGEGAGIAFFSFIGALLGIMITSQSLKAAVLTNLKEYATLRAMGVPTSSLCFVVLEQSFWIGVLGLVVSGIITGLCSILSRSMNIPFLLPWPVALGASIIVMSITLISGFLALRALNRAEPFTLLR